MKSASSLSPVADLDLSANVSWSSLDQVVLSRSPLQEPHPGQDSEPSAEAARLGRIDAGPAYSGPEWTAQPARLGTR
jgi:hypothetical protein